MQKYNYFALEKHIVKITSQRFTWPSPWRKQLDWKIQHRIKQKDSATYDIISSAFHTATDKIQFNSITTIENSNKNITIWLSKGNLLAKNC